MWRLCCHCLFLISFSFGASRRLRFVIVTFPGFVRVEVLRPSQPNRVMSSAVSLPNHTFTGQT